MKTTTKQCNKCILILPIENFYKAPKNADGYNNQCKECLKIFQSTEEQKRKRRAWREQRVIPPEMLEDQKVRSRNRRAADLDKSREYARRAYHKNKDKYRESRRAYRSQYYAENVAKIQEYTRIWRQENQDKVRAYRKEYNATHKRENTERVLKRYHSEPSFKAAFLLRASTVRVFKQIKQDKKASTEDLLGCSSEEAKQHIEEQFVEGMSWDNHGDWHIDHIKPIDWWVKNSPETIKDACHYTNLQPLWAVDNLTKSNKY